MEHSESIELLAEALNEFQKQLVVVNPEVTNPFFKSKYADLASIMLKCQPILTSHGLDVTQFLSNLNGQPALRTILIHTSGQFISDTVPLILDKQDSQGMGRAITYMRRYGYAAVLQIVIDEDDDGNSTSTPRGQAPKPIPSNPATVKKIAEIWKENGGTPQQLDVWVKKNNNNVQLTQLPGDRQQAMLALLEKKKAEKTQAAATTEKDPDIDPTEPLPDDQPSLPEEPS